MTNLNILESLRTKEELLNYFEEIGQSITEEEIEKLKKSYEQAQGNSSTLTMQQLDSVAGGIIGIETLENGKSSYNVSGVGELKLSDFKGLTYIFLQRKVHNKLIPIIGLAKKAEVLQGKNKTTYDDTSDVVNRSKLSELLNNGNCFCCVNITNPDLTTITAYDLQKERDSIPESLIVQAREVYSSFDDTHLSNSEITQRDYLK